MSTTLLLATAWALVGQIERPAGRLDDAVLNGCHVEYIDDIEVPAMEAGRLEWIEFHEGDAVKKGDAIAQIDDQQARHRRDAVLQEYRAAEIKSTNDVNVRYSMASIEVAQAQYDMAIAANEQRSRSIPKAEVNRRWHELQRARLSHEQAERDLVVEGITHEGKKAELEAAEDMIKRRQILAPVDGLVVDVMRDAGEWVNPGDPVVRVVRMDKLRVKGLVSVLEYNRTELAHRPVTIEVEMARGGQVRKERFEGKLTFADPEIQSQNEYWVSADIVNRQEGGEWLLQPGLLAMMTIHVNPAGSARQEGPAGPRRAQQGAFPRR